MFSSIGSVFIDAERLDIAKVKQRMADNDINAIDKVAHSFMEQVTHSFSLRLPVVMTVISGYDTESCKPVYFEAYAAATPPAFLKKFITKKKSVIST